MATRPHIDSTTTLRSWQRPVMLLVLMSVAMPVAFNAWSALLNNFVVERAGKPHTLSFVPEE